MIANSFVNVELDDVMPGPMADARVLFLVDCDLFSFLH
jgi:hypothetical protein